MSLEDTWSAQLYRDTVPFVYSPEYTASILQLLNPKPGEKIWDFGCGSGEVTLEVQKAVGENGLVIGVDSSQSMVEHSRANGIKHAILADVQNLVLDETIKRYNKCDAVFSNAALHWCKKDPGGVLEGAKKVLKPGGRFVVEFGGWMNCIGIRSALHQVLREYNIDPVPRDPWYFPSAEEYQELLEKHGFIVYHISLSPRITPLKGDIRGWVNLFCRNNFLEGIDEEKANRIIDDVNELCAVDCQDSRGRWSMMYTRLRVVAVWKH